MAAPVSTKMPQAAVFLVVVPKLLLFMSLGHLQACCMFPRVCSSLPKLLFCCCRWHAF